MQRIYVDKIMNIDVDILIIENVADWRLLSKNFYKKNRNIFENEHTRHGWLYNSTRWGSMTEKWRKMVIFGRKKEFKWNLERKKLLLDA